MPQIKAVDLFCGVGGLTHGLENARIDVVAGVDTDPRSRFAYEHNNASRFILKDVRDVQGADLIQLFGEADIRVLAGCAPCQPFSTYSRVTKRQRTHEDWGLLKEFGRLVQAVRPHLVTMENVPSLASQEVFEEFRSYLSGYRIWFDIVDLATIGVPQTRKRLVLIASQLGDIDFSPDTEKKTVQQAIGHMPRILAGECSDSDLLHVSPKLSPLNLQRIRASRPGGSWRDWPPELRAACHLKDTGATFPSVYGRMSWEKPAPTITTQCFGYGSGRFGHPEQDRAISLREASLLQTFPDDYAFVPPEVPVRFNTLGRLIGNAVPVRLGETIGEAIKQHVAKYVSAH